MLERLAALTSTGFVQTFLQHTQSSADPLQAGINLERWLLNTSNPNLYSESFQDHPDQLKILLSLLGASQPIADTLFQNPEFGSLFLDPSETVKDLKVEEMIAEGRRLLRSSTSYTHGLDRLRYLKQRYNLIICVNDLSGAWAQEYVWAALANLAEAIVALAFELSWSNFAEGKGLAAAPPVAIVAFGKLGGKELNYSSDIDLAYVMTSSAAPEVERELVRFLGHFGRALTDHMGRGALYRIDLRLRPYGGSGPLLSSFAGFATYYRLYAEPWEIQALIKSRVLFGNELADRWDEIKSERAFTTTLSDASLSDVLASRKRTEKVAGDDDLKRGPGGIRDVEFLCQILQLVYGHSQPAITCPSTCDALRAIANEHLLPFDIVNLLLEGYTFLRKLEHRIQMLDGRQTHELPSDPVLLGKIAETMGAGSWPEIGRDLDIHRKTIRSLYGSLLKQEEDHIGSRTLLAGAVQPNASSFLQWFDSLPEADAYYRSLSENQDSLKRVRTILDGAPRLIPALKSNLHLTELLLSGEILETQELVGRIKSLPIDASHQAVADVYNNARLVVSLQWVLQDGDCPLEVTFASLTDELLVYIWRRFGANVDLIALGSYGSLQMGITSDIDILMLSRDRAAGEEVAAQKALKFLLELRRFGLEPRVDLRLRPDGNKGLLVRSYDAFGVYEIAAMEMWERFALGQARLVYGSSDATDLVRRAAYANALTPERLAELVFMKTRIETERLKPQHIKRDVKLGAGGLNDIEWIVHLYEMSNPERVGAGEDPNMAARIQRLGKAGILNAIEVDTLLSALNHLLRTRSWIALMEFPKDLVPENPAKLERLAAAMLGGAGNDFLRVHEPIVTWVRNCFAETLERVSG